MRPEVTVLGDINVDIKTRPLDKYPEEDRQIVVPEIYLNTGGSACNTAIACARLGLKTRLIGKVGGDKFSSFLIDELKSVGVDRKIKISKKEKTGITFALAVKDSRSFITCKGTNDTFSIKDFKLKQIEGKVLVLSGFNLLNSLRKDAPRLFEYAREKGMKTALDPNWDPDGWTEKRINDIIKLLKITDFFFPDLEEGKAMSFTDNVNLVASKLLMYGTGTICLKLGEDGCLLAEKNKKQLFKAFHVDSINATGTGDVFLAGFIRETLSGKPPEEAVLFANAAAAFSTTRFGLERYPAYKEVKKFMDRGEL